jgi:hypothetical protein
MWRRELGLRNNGGVDDHRAAMAAARQNEACGSVLAHEREGRNISVVVVHSQRAAGIAMFVA